MLALSGVGRVDREIAGVKAATLGELARAGFPVPDGFVLTTAALTRFLDANELSDESPPEAILAASMPADLVDSLQTELEGLGGASVAVRSSAVAEDLPNASFAGQYETLLGARGIDAIGEGVKQCWASAHAQRVGSYAAAAGQATQSGMAVLIQRLVSADSAGVAFTANPLTGSRDEVVIEAVKGVGERLVSGQSVGDEWVVRGSSATCSRATEDALTGDQARAVAELARRAEHHYGAAQDVEWAFSGADLFLLQARPMTAVPEAADWTPPISGGWVRNLRYGEWLPDPVTPLFETWMLPRIDRSLIETAARLTGIRTTGPTYVIVNGWCFANPSGRTSTLTFLVRALAALPAIRALALQFTRPAIADALLVTPLERRWRDDVLPRYRALVASGEEALGSNAAGLVRFIDDLADLVGEYIITFNFVGGSAWRLESGLARFYRRHLWPVIGGSHQELLCGLDTGSTRARPHLVQSLDWIASTLGEMTIDDGRVGADDRRAALREKRVAAESRCRAALSSRPRLLRQFDELLGYAQRYALLREAQCADLTLGWPVARRAALSLGATLLTRGVIGTAQDVFFLTHDELTRALADPAVPSLAAVADERRRQWEQQRKLRPPLIVGRLSKLLRQMLDSNLEAMRTPGGVATGAIRGLPASPGRAGGTVRVIRSPEDFAKFRLGDILVTQAAMPAWTELLLLAAAVVTDTGTLAAHASLVAREIGIPAVVGTGDATARLHDGQVVIVDGSAGMVELDQQELPSSARGDPLHTA